MTSFASLPFELQSKIWGYALLTNPFEVPKGASTIGRYKEKVRPKANLSWERELSINLSGGDWVKIMPLETLNMLKTKASTASLAQKA